MSKRVKKNSRKKAKGRGAGKRARGKKTREGKGTAKRESKGRARRKKARKKAYLKNKEAARYSLMNKIMKKIMSGLCPDVIIHLLEYVGSPTVLDKILDIFMKDDTDIYNIINRNPFFLDCLRKTRENFLYVCKRIPREVQPQVRRLKLGDNFSTSPRILSKCILAEKFPNIQELVISNGTDIYLCSFMPFKNLKVLHFQINYEIRSRLWICSLKNYDSRERHKKYYYTIPKSVDEIVVHVLRSPKEKSKYFDGTIDKIKEMKTDWENRNNF